MPPVSVTWQARKPSGAVILVGAVDDLAGDDVVRDLLKLGHRFGRELAAQAGLTPMPTPPFSSVPM